MSYILLSFFDEVVDSSFSGIMEFRVSKITITGVFGPAQVSYTDLTDVLVLF